MGYYFSHMGRHKLVLLSSSETSTLITINVTCLCEAKQSLELYQDWIRFVGYIYFNAKNKTPGAYLFIRNWSANKQQLQLNVRWQWRVAKQQSRVCVSVCVRIGNNYWYNKVRHVNSTQGTLLLFWPQCLAKVRESLQHIQKKMFMQPLKSLMFHCDFTNQLRHLISK